MGGFWLTNLPDLVDDGSALGTGQQRPVARFMAAAVEAATSRSADDSPQTAVRCFRRRHGQRCMGRVLARLSEVPPFVAWECPQCGAAGHIRGWFRSPWDLRYVRRSATAGDRIAVPLSEAAFRYIQACPSVYYDHPEILAQATFRDGQVTLEESVDVLWTLLGVLTCEWSLVKDPVARCRLDHFSMPIAAALGARWRALAPAGYDAADLGTLLQERVRRALQSRCTGDEGTALFSELEGVVGMTRWLAQREPRRALDLLHGLVDGIAGRDDSFDDDAGLSLVTEEVTLALLETAQVLGETRAALLRLLQVYHCDEAERFDLLPHVLAVAGLAMPERRWIRAQVRERLSGKLAARTAERYETLLQELRSRRPRR
jgi:hypothetical protein